LIREAVEHGVPERVRHRRAGQGEHQRIGQRRLQPPARLAHLAAGRAGDDRDHERPAGRARGAGEEADPAAGTSVEHRHPGHRRPDRGHHEQQRPPQRRAEREQRRHRDHGERPWPPGALCQPVRVHGREA